jgi:hypothetical protein
MNRSSWLAIAALVVTSLVAIIALVREKQEETRDRSTLKRLSKPVLYTLTVVAAIFGIFQIWASEKEHETEHRVDSQKVGELTGSVKTLTETNKTQYETNEANLRKVQDQLNEIKVSKATEDLRKKMAVLQGQLDKSLAPKPKAKLQFGFYDSDLKIGEVRLDRYIPAEGGVVSVSFVVENNSEVNAADVTVWIRSCQQCKFHREPPGSIKVSGALDIERIYKISEIQPGVAVNEANVEIELPRWMTRMPVSFDYRCTDCDIEKKWQDLWVSVGQPPTPQFSAPAYAPQKPKKPKKP